MPRRPKELTEDEIAEVNAQYHQYVHEARLEPMDYVTHDTNARLDDSLRALVTSCDTPTEGLAMGYRYWCLMELLASRKGHMYDVSTTFGWTLMAIDMSGAGVPTSEDDCRELVRALLGVGLLSGDAYAESRVMSERICRNAERYAKGVADKKIGAYKTNRAKAKTG